MLTPEERQLVADHAEFVSVLMKNGERAVIYGYAAGGQVYL